MKKREVAFLGSVLLLLSAAAAVVLVGSGTSLAQTGSSVDVVMMRCATGSDFGVKAYEGSPAAPAKRSGKCPETLSLLLQDGFEIESVGYFDHDDRFITYTLIR